MLKLEANFEVLGALIAQLALMPLVVFPRAMLLRAVRVHCLLDHIRSNPFPLPLSQAFTPPLCAKKVGVARYSRMRIDPTKVG